jgi:protein associated with RNAse G/E
MEMNEAFVGSKQLIHCYKHDGKPHRSWSHTVILEETDQHFISINNRTMVTESDGRTWFTREPAICYFPKDKWFNVICMIRKNGVFYYCNIASPTLYDGEALKYIDYDLDLKVFPDYHYKVLDEAEYASHKKLYGYSDELDHIFREELDILIEMTENMEGPFRPGFAEKWYDAYLKSEKEKV